MAKQMMVCKEYLAGTCTCTMGYMYTDIRYLSLLEDSGYSKGTYSSLCYRPGEYPKIHRALYVKPPENYIGRIKEENDHD